jgi:predicted RNA-binding protein YlxR (DUF448 family)
MVLVDHSGRLAGRGAYVCQSGDCLTRALDKGALGRALKTSLPAETRAALLAGIPHDMIIQGGARGQE